MFKFCPNCTQEIKPGWKCCPYCGFKFDEVDSAQSSSSALDSALEGLMDLAKEKQTADKLRVMIIRGQIDEATAMCNELIDKDPMDTTGYIGLIRIASSNYKQFEGGDIDEQIRIAEEVFGKDELLLDGEYAAYIDARKNHFEEKERKIREAEEAERKRLEAQREAAARAEAERRRAEAERAEAEMKRIEEEIKRKAAEEEQRKKEEARIRAEAEETRKRIEKAKANSLHKRAEEDLKKFEKVCSSDGTIDIKEVTDASMTSVVFAKNIANISGFALFSRCKYLESIEVEEDNPRYHADGNCLIDTSGKELVLGCKNSVIPTDGSVTKIGGGAFEGCSGLTELKIPPCVKSISVAAFFNCSELTHIDIPSGETNIAYVTFSGCRKLKSVKLPATVTRIDSEAFLDCSSLTEINIPSRVTKIGDRAFEGCEALKKIEIPRGCKFTAFGKDKSFPKGCKVIKV